MSVARIEISQDVLRRLHAQAVAAYPFECCGALLGTEGVDARRVHVVLPLDNTSGEDRTRRFSISPRDYLRSEREASLLDLQLLGFYHSHPDHPARPSDTDRMFAQPGFSYPILSTGSTGVIELRSWRIDSPDGEYREEEILLQSEHAPPT